MRLRPPLAAVILSGLLGLLSLENVFAAPAQRLALVIGNGKYSFSPLSNPANDATDMAAALKGLGFTIILKTNAGLREMEEAIQNFGNRLKRGGVGLFYFAGHGVQVSGTNYLLPIGARINKETDVKYEAVDAGKILDEMSNAGNDLNIVILDACRDNPFARTFRSASRGLAVVGVPTGTFISYSTAAGQVALDGEGRNSPYTAALLEYIGLPGLPIEQVFKRVRQKLDHETGGRQIPWELSSLRGDFYFNEKSVANLRQEMEEKQRLEAERARAAALSRQREEEQRLDAERRQQEEDRKRREEEDRRLAMGRRPPVSEKTFTNSIGMKFVLVPAGRFTMGIPAHESGRYDGEGPQHEVEISLSFYVGQHEVTQGQWRAVMGNNPSRFSSCGDDCPVESVSWNDVQEFIRRLNAKEGAGKYRLPTEAEWEYACRAGSRGAYGYGDDAGRLGECAWYEGNSGGKTHPVGQKKPNGWGLYDMHGNVWEWVQDWYGSYTTEAVTDPSGPGGGSLRVLRGGSFIDRARYLRCADRVSGSPASRGFLRLGFRLVRTP